MEISSRAFASSKWHDYKRLYIFHFQFFKELRSHKAHQVGRAHHSFFKTLKFQIPGPRGRSRLKYYFYSNHLLCRTLISSYMARLILAVVRKCLLGCYGASGCRSKNGVNSPGEKVVQTSGVNQSQCPDSAAEWQREGGVV